MKYMYLLKLHIQCEIHVLVVYNTGSIQWLKSTVSFPTPRTHNVCILTTTGKDDFFFFGIGGTTSGGKYSAKSLLKYMYTFTYM